MNSHRNATPSLRRPKGQIMTIHETTIIRPLMRWISLGILKCTGWKTEGNKPDLDRYVIIAAPHTSNWDFIYTLCFAFVYKLSPQIMMKKAWFRWPLGPLFRWLGALPIDRSRSRNVVAQSIEAFKQRPRMELVVPPSGTRKKVQYWKTGFLPYRIRGRCAHRPWLSGLRPQSRRIRPALSSHR